MEDLSRLIGEPIEAEKEQWKPVFNYEGLYEVSSFGRVKALEKTVDGKLNSKRTNKEIILKQHPNRKGYLSVTLTKNFKRWPIRVHRLVAAVFIPNPDNKPQVNHEDGIKTNNHYKNLSWATNGENGKHAWDNGLRTKKVGGNSKVSKLTNEDAAFIRKISKENNLTGAAIQRQYFPHVNKHTVSNILSFKTYKTA